MPLFTPLHTRTKLLHTYSNTHTHTQAWRESTIVPNISSYTYLSETFIHFTIFTFIFEYSLARVQVVVYMFAHLHAIDFLHAHTCKILHVYANTYEYMYMDNMYMDTCEYLSICIHIYHIMHKCIHIHVVTCTVRAYEKKIMVIYVCVSICACVYISKCRHAVVYVMACACCVMYWAGLCGTF